MSGRAKAHEAIVSRYLWVRNLITTGQGHKIEQSPYPYESVEPEKALEAIRSAVIFEIPLNLFAGIYRAADIYTCTQIAGLEWTYDPDENPNPPESIRKDMPHYWESITEAGRHAPYTDKFPFDAVWFGLEPSLPLKENQRTFYNCHQWKHATLAGVLATADGNVWSVVVVANTNLTTDSHGNIETSSKWGINLHLMQERSGSDGIWHGPLTLTPWIVPALLEWVNDHKVVTVEEVPRTLSYRRLVDKAAKRRKIKMRIPPPYYAVTMKDTLIEDIERAASFDVLDAGDSGFTEIPSRQWGSHLVPHEWQWQEREKKGSAPKGV